MERVKVRKANDKDKSLLKSLYSQFFTEDSKAYTNYYFNNMYNKNNTYILENDKKELLCALQLRLKTLIFNDQKVKTNLIVAVTTPLKHQRKGYMATLMEYVLSKLESKHEFTLIQAYNWDVYKKFGFKDSHFQDTYQVNHKDLTGFENVELVKNISSSHLNRLYKDFTKTLNGYQNRTKAYYDQLIETAKIEKLKWFISKNAYILVSGNNVIDMAFRHENDLFSLILSTKLDVTVNLPTCFKAKKGLKISKIDRKLVMQWTGKGINKYKKIPNLYINEFI